MKLLQLHLGFFCLLLLSCNNLDIKHEDKTISPLPFQSNNINKNLKNLPKIDSVRYHKLNTQFDGSFHRSQNLINLKTYNNQLPNFGQFNVYYTEFDCDLEYDETFNDLCTDFVSLRCGFLIFYNAAAKIADIITISNSYYLDAGIHLNCVIQKNYTLNLVESEMTDGDDGDSIETDYSSKYSITIENNNTLEVVQIANE